jgi:hypothetical protein
LGLGSGDMGLRVRLDSELSQFGLLEADELSHWISDMV